MAALSAKQSEELRVLIVEDDWPSLELLNEFLIPFGVRPTSIINSRHAVALIDTEKLDGIFLDLLMPGVDGFELIRIARASSLNKRTPIVVVSGREDKETMQQAFAAGATFFLAKPLDRLKLSRLINTTLGSMLRERTRSNARATSL
jgi:CheY-like chemotaxis protein